MKAAVLLSIFGVCLGLQPGLEYQYRYSGRVASGITDLKTQFSAAGIQADVIVQVAEDLTGVVQFSNVEVGDFHGTYDCDIRAPLPIEYHRLEEGVQLLETPFRIIVNASKVIQFLEVPQEPAWITNIRKAIVNIFRILPFGVRSEEATNLLHVPNFSVREETIIGRCTNWYNVAKLSEAEAARVNYEREQTIEIDAQRYDATSGSLTSKGSKGAKGAKGVHGAAKGAAKGGEGAAKGKGTKTSQGQIPARLSSAPIEETLWSVVRATAFEDCENAIKIMSHISSDAEKLLSRSSIGTYLIRGGVKDTRIEKAVVEGSITIFTQEDQKEHYDTFTNQTVELKAVRPIQEELLVTYQTQQFQTWQYEVDRRVAQQSTSTSQPILEQLLTGVELTPQMVVEIKNIINIGIQEISDRMPRNPSYRNSLVEDMHHVVEAISVLNQEQLEQIYTQYVAEYTEAKTLNADTGAIEFQEKKIFILKQAMIVSGTKPALNFLLTKMTNKAFRYEDDETVSNFFNEVQFSLKSPSLIPKMMVLVMQLTWDDKEQDDKSVALLTFSQLVNKMCLNGNRKFAYWDASCNKANECDTATILNTFIPHLYSKLEDEESPDWKRLIYLQALSNLGTPQTIKLLKPYILGVKETHLGYRKNAIWSLSRANMHSTAKAQVFQTLMPVFWNRAENYEVRSLAFLVMATWSDSISWWQEMAAATWREPSSKVANFISTTIRTAAHMEGGGELSRTAAQVEHLTKPAAPASITHSLNYYLLEYVYSKEHGHPFTFAWLANTASILPSEIYLRLKFASFLGYTHDWKMSIQQSGFDEILINFISNVLLAKKKVVDEDAVAIVMDMLNELQENIQFHNEPKERELYVKMQQVFKLMTTLPADRSQRIAYENIFANRPRFTNIPHHSRYVYALVAMPTDMGLPFIAKHTAQNAWWVSYVLNLSQSASPFGAKGTSSVTLDASRMLTAEVKTLIPWSKKFAVGTGSEHLISVLLPLKVNHLFNFKTHELQLDFEPITEEEVHLVDAHNTPFTAQYGSFPTVVHHRECERTVIKKYEECPCSCKMQVLPSAVGIWIEAEWNGDTKKPFNFRGLYKGEFSLFTPTLMGWDYQLVYDPESSPTMMVTTTFTFVSTDRKSSSHEVSNELQSVGQETQGSSDYSQYSQFSQSASSDFQDFDSDEFQQQSSSRQRIARLQQQVMPATGGHVRSFSIGFLLQGTVTKEYEAVLTWATGSNSSRRTTKFQLTWLKHVPHGIVDQPHATCLNVQITKPRFMPMISTEDALNADFQATVKAEIHDGTSCDDSPVLELEGTMDVSQTQLDYLSEKMNPGKCGPVPDFLPIDLITSQIYDSVHVKAQWTEDFPPTLKNLTYYAEAWIRGITFPDIFYDSTVANDENTIEIDASKCLQTQKWNIHTTEPQEKFIIEDYKASQFFNLIASPAAPSQTLFYNIFNGRDHTACVVDQSKIRTFDGLVIPYKPDPCWTVMVMDATGEGYGSLDVRFSDGEWEARIIYPREGLFLELTKTQLKVNGEDYRSDDERYHIDFVDDGAILTFPFLTDAILKVSDKVYFLEEQLFRSKVGGVCGNFDGESYQDMTGPKGCLYTDPELFVKSWTAPGVGCSGFTYQAKKRPVVAYQDVCIHKTDVPTGIANPNTLNDCVEWEYKERSEGIRKCKALVPTPKCKTGCRPTSTSSEIIMYECEATQRNNLPINECYPRRFVTNFPSNCVPQ